MEKQEQIARRLISNFLPKHEVLYFENEAKKILGLEFNIAGVIVKLDTGEECYGSSCSTNENPILYAAYECLERYAIQKVKIDTDPSNNFKLSLSNGVAIHTNPESAKLNAINELVERHEILKSWYFDSPVMYENSIRTTLFPKEFLNEYDVSCVIFRECNQFAVTGIFAFPKNQSNPMIHSFGCSFNIKSSFQKSKKEFITRLGFLWDEAPDVNIPPQNTPLFHQDFYLRSDNHYLIREWLEKNQTDRKAILTPSPISNIDYISLAPDSWANQLHVYKATVKDTIPLFFGIAPKEYFNFQKRCDIPHPVI